MSFLFATHRRATYCVHVSNLNKLLIHSNDIWVLIYNVVWITVPLAQERRPSSPVLAKKVITCQTKLHLPSRATLHQRSITVVDVKGKAVVAEQELVLDTVHGHRLQRLSMALDKVELRVRAVGDVPSSDAKVLRVDDLEASCFHDNAHLGL